MATHSLDKDRYPRGTSATTRVRVGRRAAAVYRHPAVVRLWHWINLGSILVLLCSGLQIFNAHPHLYWGNDANGERRFFSIATETLPNGELAGYLQLGPRQVDTTGVFGVSYDHRGQPREQAMPNWLILPSGRQLALGRRWHLTFAWLFALNMGLYLVYRSGAGQGFRHAIAAGVGRLPGLAKTSATRVAAPASSKYRPLQRAAYSVVLFGMLPLAILSGLAMSPWLDAQWPLLPALFGGRQSARAVHFILAMSLAAFTVGHIGMVIATGFFRNLHGMISGWYYPR